MEIRRSDSGEIFHLQRMVPKESKWAANQWIQISIAGINFQLDLSVFWMHQGCVDDAVWGTTEPWLSRNGWAQGQGGPFQAPSSGFSPQMRTWTSRIVHPTMGCGLSMLCCFFSLVVPLGSAAKRLLVCKKAVYTHGPVDVDMQPATLQNTRENLF